MNGHLHRLAERIRAECDDLDRVAARIQEGWHLAQQSDDDHYVDGVALNLHGLYTGLERLFELIAKLIDGTVPSGANWHQVLLEQMAMEVPAVRPAVISEETQNALDEYRGFRHVVRNIYTFKFDPVKVLRLVEHVPEVFGQARSELLSFAEFLEQRADA